MKNTTIQTKTVYCLKEFEQISFARVKPCGEDIYMSNDEQLVRAFRLALSLSLDIETTIVTREPQDNEIAAMEEDGMFHNVAYKFAFSEKFNDLVRKTSHAMSHKISAYTAR